ncbi:MAG: hypothetical protein GQ565_08175 [Candidatus Aegiribacteria sp.]|nr:hypothetical protein [Candidatus Aegiribacteria sp.]
MLKQNEPDACGQGVVLSDSIRRLFRVLVAGEHLDARVGFSNEMVAIWEQSGDEWIRHCIFSGSDPLICRFSDMDGDGILDITAAWWGRIAWFEYTTYGFIGWMESSRQESLSRVSISVGWRPVSSANH